MKIKRKGLSRDRLVRVIAGLTFCFIAAFLAGSKVESPFYLPKSEHLIGKIALRDVQSPINFMFEDKEKTKKEQELAAKKVLPIYDYDYQYITNLRANMRRFFRDLRLLTSKQIEKKDQDNQAMETKIPDLNKILTNYGIVLTEEIYKWFKEAGFPKKYESFADKTLSKLENKKIINDFDLDPMRKKGRFVIRYVKRGELKPIREIETNFDSSIITLADALNVIENSVSDLLDSQEESKMHSFLKAQLKANLLYNEYEVARKKQAMINSVKPIMISIKKNQTIIRKGEQYTAKHKEIIDALLAHYHRETKFYYYIVNFLLFLVALWVIYRFSSRNIKKSKLTTKDAIFLWSIGVFVMLLTKAFIIIASALNMQTGIPEDLFFYLIPAAFLGMIVRLALNSEITFGFSVLMSIIITAILGYNAGFFIYFLMGNLVGANYIGKARHTSNILKAGLMVCVSNIILLIVTTILFRLNEMNIEHLGYGIAFAGFSGLLSSVLVPVTITTVESLFNYTTDFKLLELANPDNPAIRELMLNAPGSYQHSMLVATLVEAAAECIGANPLLSRVGAYYHDIGKSKNPRFFAENQLGGTNPHDKLSPSLSATIIKAHIKNGVELAQKYHLGKPIIDIIRQHHGTTLIRYFYQKALDNKDRDAAPVSEVEFRYPGPKPQFREAALVMIGDAIEATARSMYGYSPEQMMGMIQKTINRLFSDGQFSECDLTLKDLHLIAQSFMNTLQGMYHYRPEYPEQKVGDANGDRYKKTRKGKVVKDQEVEEESSEDIKRLGLE